MNFRKRLHFQIVLPILSLSNESDIVASNHVQTQCHLLYIVVYAIYSFMCLIQYQVLDLIVANQSPYNDATVACHDCDFFCNVRIIRQVGLISRCM